MQCVIPPGLLGFCCVITFPLINYLEVWKHKIIRHVTIDMAINYLEVWKHKIIRHVTIDMAMAMTDCIFSDMAVHITQNIYTLCTM